MKFSITAKVLGILLMFFSLSMLTPVLVSFYYHDGDSRPFIIAFLITVLTGLFLWLPTRRTEQELRTRDGFIIVFLMWFVLGLFGALPFMLSYAPHVPWTDALFESVSGLTTTGATALVQIDGLPRSVLYYRNQLQFLGGMGIIVLAVAIMPLIGVGGMQLFKAEATGPMKENKLTPRITETAKALWAIYVGLNIICALSYWGVGMTPFDAICYAFGTISTGGYAPHNASIAYYPHAAVYIVSIVFMLLGGINFSLHYIAFKKRSLKGYWRDGECRNYLLIFLAVSIVVSFVLYIFDVYHSLWQAFLNGFYQVVSFGTTTGFTSTATYDVWPLFVPILLLFMGMMGACSGSTTGGIKIIRALLLKKQIVREMNYLIHPSGTFPVKLNEQVIPDRVISGVWAFIAAYLVVFIVMWLMLMATGESLETSFSALATCISNTGPGLGEVSSNFSTVSSAARWILTFAMLIGRLEVFTVLVLLSPAFWRR